MYRRARKLAAASGRDFVNFGPRGQKLVAYRTLAIPARVRGQRSERPLSASVGGKPGASGVSELSRLACSSGKQSEALRLGTGRNRHKLCTYR